MDKTGNRVKLYSAQSSLVADILDRDGICHSKREYVERKYGESAKVFLAAYDFYVREAQKYVERPNGAEFPYWAFKDLHSVEQSGDSRLLKLEVPVDEVIFFDMYDWNKILNLQYLGEDESDEEEFKNMLVDYGVKRESDVILTNFYPHLKSQVQNSWKRLFNHHEDIKNGNYEGVRSVQVGLWRIKKDWME